MSGAAALPEAARGCSEMDRRQRTGQPPTRLQVVLGLTASFMVVEAVGGWISGSLALLADAGHMLTDVGALGLALFTAWMAQRPADDRRTFGWLRGEILAALANGVALLVIAGLICVEAWQRLHTPEPIRTGLFAGVAAAGLVVNLVSLRLLHAGHQHSLNSRAAYLHVFADMLGSVGALAAAAIIALTGWTAADPVLSVLLALMIVVGAWRLVRESVDVLLESVPAHVRLGEVREVMLRVPGVTDVHDVHVWTVTSGVVALAAHATVPELARHPGALVELGEGLAALGIRHVTIQIECGGECTGPVPAGAGAPADHHHHGPGGHAHHH